MFENLAIDSWQQAVLYLVTAGAMSCLWLLSKRRVGFSIRVGIALLFGLTIGFVFQERAVVLRPIGLVYVRLIMMIVVPLVFTSIIKSFTDLKDQNKLKSIGLKTLFWLLTTTGIATFIAIIFGNVFNLGEGFSVGSNAYTPREVIPIEQVLLDLVPSNIVNHMASNQMVPVIIFAIFISIAMILQMKKNPESVQPFKSFIDSFQAIMVRLTKMVMRFTPYGVLALIANAAARSDIDALRALGLYIIVFYAAMITHFVIVHLGLITLVARLNPWQFIKNIYPAQIVGFTSQSSYATLPVTIRTLTSRVGVNDRISSFVAPLGANVGMNACGGMFPAFVAIITANVFGLDLSIAEYGLIILTTMVASIGIAGVPGIASIAATVVLASLGLPLEGIGLVIGVDALVDMGRTALNITGTMVSATLVAVSEDELDKEVYKQENVKEKAII